MIHSPSSKRYPFLLIGRTLRHPWTREFLSSKKKSEKPLSQKRYEKNLRKEKTSKEEKLSFFLRA